MLKYIIILLVLSIIAVLTLGYVGEAMHFLTWSFDKIASWTGVFFRGNSVGLVIRQVIALVLIPLLCGLIPAGIYWFFKRSSMKYLADIIFGSWLVMLTLLAVHR